MFVVHTTMKPATFHAWGATTSPRCLTIQKRHGDIQKDQYKKLGKLQDPNSSCEGTWSYINHSQNTFWEGIWIVHG